MVEIVDITKYKHPPLTDKRSEAILINLNQIETIHRYKINDEIKYKVEINKVIYTLVANNGKENAEIRKLLGMTNDKE